MARLTISIPEQLANLAAQRAAMQKRSASAYVALLIEEDVRQNSGPEALLRDYIHSLGVLGSVAPQDLAKIVDAARSTVELGLTPEEAETALRNALKAKIAG